ncbi:hypothetical protein [Lacticaseibacillus songhuajiangensis]|jgi:hypothetical protein|uniref:hypothetical protein n=1 Tax=Lacticaseibacillus songhuajiangensis TaxID=1296539 RepID=UPI000F779969|nr:hypothetical protein [Lacticaseibacillus songhuajiangensis]
MQFNAQQLAVIATLTPRAQQVCGLIMWMDAPDHEIIMPRSQFYARLHYFPRNDNMMAIQQEVAAMTRELRASVLPQFMIHLGDNDLGEDEMLYTISY